MMEKSLPEATTAEEGVRPATLRSLYLEAVEERCVELGSPLTRIERLGYEARAEMMFPDEVRR